MRLLVRPQPQAGDSLAGYLMTVANRNGMTFPQWCEMLGLPAKAFHNPGDVMYGRSPVEPFADSIGLAADRLAAMAYQTNRGWTRPTQVRYRGMTVPFELMRGATAPFCPACIEERCVPSADGDMVLHTACATHRLRLISRCPNCRERLTWHRGWLDCCPCGFELKDAPHQAVEHPVGFTDEKALVRIAALIAFAHSGHQGTLNLGSLRELDIAVVANELTALASAADAGDALPLAYASAIAAQRAEQNGALGPRWAVLPLLLSLPDLPEVSRELRALAALLPTVSCSDMLNITRLSLTECAALLAVSEHVVKRRCATGLLKKLSDRTGQTPMMVCARSAADFSKSPASSPSARKAVPPQDLLTVAQAAETLGIYPDAVRRFIKAGLLRGQKGIGTQVLLQKTDVAGFQCDFVFVKELAGAWATNHTNLAERLMAVGVKPVSGPVIDGGLVYLFRRAEIDEQSRAAVAALDSYVTRAGRKPKGQRAAQLEGYLTAQEVADALGISLQHVAQLVAHGALKDSTPEGISSNRRYIAQADFGRYCRRYRNNPELISVSRAAACLGLTVSTLRKRYLDTEVLAVISDGLERYVEKAALTELQRQLSELISTTDACRLLGAPRYYLNNLVQIGRLRIADGLPTSGRALRLFYRRDIESLRLTVGAVSSTDVVASNQSAGSSSSSHESRKELPHETGI